MYVCVCVCKWCGSTYAQRTRHGVNARLEERSYTRKWRKKNKRKEGVHLQAWDPRCVTTEEALNNSHDIDLVTLLPTSLPRQGEREREGGRERERENPPVGLPAAPTRGTQCAMPECWTNEKERQRDRNQLDDLKNSLDCTCLGTVKWKWIIP